MDGLELERAAPDADGIYQDLLDAFDGLSDDQSLEFAAMMIIALSNHIGDKAVVSEAIRLCRASIESS
ncbi:MAG: DUF2783 domain-containing protein [Rhodobacteraceae bacterium]|nr:DUF2783 domain-containing protein [Paracoccaceae bacterium]